MKISEIMLIYRAKNNLTQEELAEKLNITKAWACKLENEKVVASRVLEMKIKMLEKEG